MEAAADRSAEPGGQPELDARRSRDPLRSADGRSPDRPGALVDERAFDLQPEWMKETAIEALARPVRQLLPRPKMLALDIDGTILDGQGDLHDAVVTAVSAVAASGVQVVLSTGRSPWHGVQEVAVALGLPGVHISMQGAVIGDPATDRIERVRWLSPDVYGETLRFADEHGLGPIVGTLDGHRSRQIPEGIDFLPPSTLSGGTYRQVDDLRRVLDERPVRVFLPTRPERHRALRHHAERRLGAAAAIVWSDLSGFEVLSPGTNKGEAVAWLAGAREIDLAAVAAVGDAANDTEMLRIVGRSAAMRVAPAHVCAAADIIVPSSDEDGVLDALGWFFPDLASWFEAIPRRHDLGPTASPSEGPRRPRAGSKPRTSCVTARARAS